MDQKALLNWFSVNQRSFPWRVNRTPYRVWISETMLQQTRASVVIAYFENWMEKFPTLESLAKASFEEVLKMWEGLGYYSRARNLHEAALQILQEFGGQIPSNIKQLRQIKGIGPYTANAIMAFAFQKGYLALDANAKRVLSRLDGIQHELSQKKGLEALEKTVQRICSKNFLWEVSEALIELGAMVCIPNPKCELCPIQKNCIAKKQNLQAVLPIKKPGKKIQKLKRVVLIFSYEDSFVIQKQAKGQVMADLCEFPYFEYKKTIHLEDIIEWCWEKFKIEPVHIQPMDTVKHAYTTFQVTLLPFYLECKTHFTCDPWKWVSHKEMDHLTFSSGHRRILQTLMSEVLCESCT